MLAVASSSQNVSFYSVQYVQNFAFGFFLWNSRRRKNFRNKNAHKCYKTDFVGHCRDSVKPEDFFVGAEFFEDREMEIVDAALAFAAECKAEEYLARCEQCRAGLEKKLFQKSHSKQSIKQALDYLEEKNLLNDLRFSEIWLRNHIITKPQGRIRLLKELISRGIKTGDAKKAVDDFFKVNDEIQLCHRAYKKALKSGKKDEKLIKYLMDSGFSYKLILSVADEE